MPRSNTLTTIIAVINSIAGLAFFAAYFGFIELPFDAEMITLILAVLCLSSGLAVILSMFGKKSYY